MTATKLLRPTDSDRQGGVRGIYDICCRFCGEPRPVEVRTRRDAHWASLRPCRECYMAGVRADGGKPKMIVSGEATCPSCKQTRTLRAATAAQLETACLRLCRTCSAARDWQAASRPGPSTAASRAYKPDLDVVDWVAVERLIAGTLPGGWRVSSRPDRLAAVARLTAQGMGAYAIASRLGVTARTVVRLRADIRADADRRAEQAAATTTTEAA